MPSTVKQDKCLYSPTLHLCYNQSMNRSLETSLRGYSFIDGRQTTNKRVCRDFFNIYIKL